MFCNKFCMLSYKLFYSSWKKGLHISSPFIRLICSPSNNTNNICLSSSKAFSSSVCTGIKFFNQDNKMTDTKQQRLVIIDTDAGIDDSVALFVALRAHEDPNIPFTILAITAVGGNTTVDHVCPNVATVLETVGQSKIPIFRGAQNALVQPIPKRAVLYHGTDGFGDAALVKASPNLTKEHAASALIRLVHEYEGQVTVVALGPLTNLALAINLDPTFLTSIKELWLMGGNISGIGNIASSAEFNFWADPEAAFVLLNAEIPSLIKVVPWETCKLKAKFDMKFRTETLGTMNTPQANLLNLIEEKILLRNTDIHAGWVSCDALVTAILVNPKIIRETADLVCTVELAGNHTRGMMVVDHRSYVAGLRKNVHAITEVDVDQYAKTMIWGLGGDHFEKSN